MLVFVTAYDAATQSNLVIAKKIIGTGDTPLLESNATRAELYRSLSQIEPDCSIFAMSHGNKEYLLDNNQGHAIAIQDAGLFAHRAVFAWACYTGTSLGYQMAQAQAIWWGYDSAVTAPDLDPQYELIFCGIFQKIKADFYQAANESQVKVVLEDLKNLCDQAADTFDRLYSPDDIPPSFALYSCCRQIWSNLCVWLPLKSVPCKHPDAPSAHIEI